jgi:putative transposase
LPEEKENICVFARAHPEEGYRRLTYMMLDADIVACSAASVYRVLKAANLLAGSSPQQSKKGTGFVQPLLPHEHWHIDISYLNIGGTYYFLCSILDGYSRFIVHSEIREKMGESDVETILQRAREFYPNAKPRIISDNGPQFLARDFKEFIRIAEMTHVKTSPYYPQSNGKIERWHKTLKGECIRINVPLCVEEARRLVCDYIARYNTERLHSAIGYITPKDMLDGKAKTISDERDRKLDEARDRRKKDRAAAEQRKKDSPPVEATRPPIDFEMVRTLISIAAVLQLLGCEVHAPSQHRGPCPLHRSSRGTARCFSANLDHNLFRCFKCGQSGNAIDLWAKATKQTPYDAALDLCNRLNIQVPLLQQNTPASPTEPVIHSSGDTMTKPQLEANI